MTDIQPYQDTTVAPAIPEPTDDALNAIMRQAEAMSAAHKLGTALAGTDMVPQDYKGKPDNATAAILYGAEVGLSAIQSLQQIFIVHGKPAMYGRTMAALVMKAGHEISEVEATQDSVTWQGRRRDNGREFTAQWTLARAELAGYTKNAKYKTNPIEMLRAKAQTEVCRTLFPDVLLGMAHSVEDLELERVQVISERSVPPKRGVAGLKAALTPAQAADPEPGVNLQATAGDIKKLDAALTDAGILDQEERRTFLSARVGRELRAARDLTRDEVASIVRFVKDGEEPAGGAE